MINDDNADVLDSQRIVDLLFSYMSRISSERNVDNLLMLTADLGRAIVMADRCSLWLLDETTDELCTRVAHGVDELRIPRDAGFVGYSLATGNPVIVDDAYMDVRFDRRSDERTHYRTKSVITMPLKNADGNVIGVFQAINKQCEGGVFTTRDLKRLALVSVYSAKTVESTLLAEELVATQKEIIHILGDASEYRSQETGDHIQRVADVSFRLAKYYGLPASDCELIRLAAPLHDLGKIGIPDAVLNKPSRLNSTEMAVMMTHSIIGREMLSQSKRKLLRFAAEIAGSHHERWDGSGYPGGLKGAAIPLAGRICAVADVLDALSCPRCYKEAWPEDEVREEFVRQRGVQFQPELVDVLLEHWDEFFEHYRNIK